MQTLLWINNDLTFFTADAPAGFINAVDGYRQTDGSQHVNVITGDGHVHELYRSPDPAVQWVDNDLTGFANATPAYCPVLVGYAQSNDSQHVLFIDQFGCVHELYRSSTEGAQWVDNNLTRFAGGTAATVLAATSSLAGYSQNDNSQIVVFMDSYASVHMLHRSNNPVVQWEEFNTISLIDGSVALLGSPLAAYSQPDGSIHIYLLDVTGNIHELYLAPAAGGQWVDNNLSGYAGAQPAAYFSALAAYTQGDGSQHVNFLDSNGHIHELYRTADPAAQWVDNDLTKFAAGAAAAQGSAIKSCSLNDGGQHVSFIDQNGHLHDLYRAPSAKAQWIDIDLTAQDGGDGAGFTGKLDVYFQSDGSQHVNFVSADGHVHELYGSYVGAWPAYQHDSRRTGRSSVDTSANKGTQKWLFSTSGNPGSSPVVSAEGTLYFACTDGNLYAIDAGGALKWKSTIATSAPGSAIQQGVPTIGVDGTVYFASDNSDFTAGQIQAVNPSDGSVKWSFPTGGGGNESAPAIGVNGTIYFGSTDHNFYALNGDGSLKWTLPVGSAISSSPAIAADGTIYFGSGVGPLYAVTDGGSGGTVKWTYPADSIVQSSPAIGSDDVVYASALGTILYAVNPDGTLKWMYTAPEYELNQVSSSPAIGADGTIYFATTVPDFRAVNPDGSLKWVLAASPSNSPVIGADGTIYIGSAGDLYAVLDNGQGNVTIKWTFSTNGVIEASPAIGADGTIFICSDDGNLYALA
jgi:outer membrane protein assembly factor BamB